MLHSGFFISDPCVRVGTIIQQFNHFSDLTHGNYLTYTKYSEKGASKIIRHLTICHFQRACPFHPLAKQCCFQATQPITNLPGRLPCSGRKVLFLLQRTWFLPWPRIIILMLLMCNSQRDRQTDKQVETQTDG